MSETPTPQNKPKINLSLNSVGILILFKSGVIYTNQSGGYSCFNPEEEGILVLPTYPHLVIGAPVEVYLCPIEAKLRALNWLSIGVVDHQVASKIDAIL